MMNALLSAAFHSEEPVIALSRRPPYFVSQTCFISSVLTLCAFSPVQLIYDFCGSVAAPVSLNVTPVASAAPSFIPEKAPLRCPSAAPAIFFFLSRWMSSYSFFLEHQGDECVIFKWGRKTFIYHLIKFFFQKNKTPHRDTIYIPVFHLWSLIIKKALYDRIYFSASKKNQL